MIQQQQQKGRKKERRKKSINKQYIYLNKTGQKLRVAEPD